MCPLLIGFDRPTFSAFEINFAKPEFSLPGDEKLGVRVGKSAKEAVPAGSTNQY
jgi:hypothetical protein